MSATKQHAQATVSNRAKRDGRGRFLPGTAPGPGNPHARRVHELKAAVHKATSATAIRSVVRSMITAAKGGDVAAARLVLEYAIGRPRTAPGDPLALDLPALDTAKGLVDAAGQVARAMAAGEVATDEGQRIAAVLELARRTYETSQLETRIRQLEDLLSEERSDETTHR